MAETITARSNERVKAARALMQGKVRRQRGLHLVEGEKLVLEAWRSGCTLAEIFAEEVFAPPEELLDGQSPVYPVSRSVMEALCESQNPQHLCAVVRTPALTPPPVYPEGLVVVLDRVQDPGNVGTILRTADALGAAAIVLGAGCADPFAGKTLRAAMGSTYHLPLYAADAAEALLRMQTQGFCCICGHLRGSEALPALPSRVALAIGSEGSGVSDAVAASCIPYRLPMRGRAESLNAAVAAALLIYELSKHMEG